MKNTFKIFFLLVLSLILVGCDNIERTAKITVQDYLNNYKLDELIENEDLSDNQKNIYKEVLQRQYKNLKYKVINEKYMENESIITVELTVYNYYKAQQEIVDYLKNNRKEFYKDGVYDEELYIDYKLDKMKNYKETVTYVLDFKFKKENNRWELQNLSNDDIEKIHGIYNNLED